MHFGLRYGLPLTSTGAMLVVSLAGAPAVASAQGIDVPVPGRLARRADNPDACQKAVDIFAFMTPQISVSASWAATRRSARPAR